MNVYVVSICHPAEIGGEFHHFKVQSPRFQEVEGWALAKASEIGGQIWSIEKMYFNGAEEMFGDTDAVLEVVNW